MRSHEVEHRIFQIKVATQVMVLLGMRQRFAYQSPIALTRSEIVTLNIRGVDLLVAKNLGDDFTVAKDDSPTDFNHSTVLTMFVNLTITQFRVKHSAGFFAGSASPTFERWWFRRAVVGNQCLHISGQLVRSKQRWPPIGFGLKFGQKCRCFFLAAVVRQMRGDSQMRRQSDGPPYPGITDIGWVIGLKMLLFFLTKVHSSSI